MLSDKKYSDFALVGLDTNNPEKFYIKKYSRWYFFTSEVFDAEKNKLTKNNKTMRRLFNNFKDLDITGKNGTIILNERIFIEREEIPRVKELKRLSPIQKEKQAIYLKYLENKLIELKGKKEEKQKETTLQENKYPHIFKNDEAYTIFDKYIKIIKKNELAHYSFIYQRMKKDDLILETIFPKNFIAFLEKHKEITLEKLKTYNDSKGGNKEHIYNTIKLQYIK